MKKCKKIICIVMAICLLMSTLPIAALADTIPSEWAAPEVALAESVNIVTERVKEDYQKEITREEFCELVVRLYTAITGVTPNAVETNFIDVNNDEVSKAYGLGIVYGVTDTEFVPDAYITRQEICAMLVRCIDKAIPGADVNNYPNITEVSNEYSDAFLVSDWARPNVFYAVDNDIMKGVYAGLWNTLICPLDNTTREQAVLMNWRVFDNKDNLVDTTNTTSKYTVSFDLNYDGAVGAPANQRVKGGEKVSKPDVPVREGFEFQGWFSSINEYNVFDFNNTIINNDVTLYAKWININDMTDTDGDGLYDSLEAFYNTDINNIDTDSDGLTDYQEIALCNTNPLLKDTDNNGIIDYDEDADSDLLKNGEEISKNTNPLLEDTDNDDLSDKDEIDIYHTNPLLDDTDGDGVSDGAEVKLGTDPLIAQTTFKINIDSNEADTVKASVDINLSGDQVESLKIESLDETLFPDNIPGYMGKAYNFSVDGEFDSATISFEFDSKEIPTTARPTIYHFNEEEQLLEELPTTVVGNVASITTTHFSTYILLDKTEFDKVWDTEIKPPLSNSDGSDASLSIAFVIDYSASMDWNDPNKTFKTLSKAFISKLRDNKDSATVIEFVRRATLVAALTTDKNTLNNAIEGIYYDDGYNSYSGTDGSSGIKMAIDELAKSDTDYKYIIFMTDGEDNGYSYSYDDLIEDALSKNITIYSIGMGDASEDILKKLADKTEGKYYHATTDSDNSDLINLDDVFVDIESETVDMTTDTDEDGIPDYYEDKLVTFNGVKLTLDKNNPDCDNDGVIDGDEVTVEYSYSDGRVYGKMKSNPNEKDSDDDGIDDKNDTAPLVKGLAGGVIGKFTIISCHPNNEGLTGGHAWVSYKSYVKDDLDFSSLYAGYVYKEDTGFDIGVSDIYNIPVGGNVAIGNAGTQGTSGALSTLVGSCGGILYNREYYGAYKDHDFYMDVAAYSREITQAQYNNMINYVNNNSYYNLYNHNCSTVASGAWEAAYGNDDGLEAQTSGISHGLYSVFDTPATLKNNILKLDGADTDYRETMLKILSDAYYSGQL